MTMLAAVREFAEGLARGLALFLTARQNIAETALVPVRIRRRNSL